MTLELFLGEFQLFSYYFCYKSIHTRTVSHDWAETRVNYVKDQLNRCIINIFSELWTSIDQDGARNKDESYSLNSHQ